MTVDADKQGGAGGGARKSPAAEGQLKPPLLVKSCPLI
jgi:hypothetical protein